LLLARDLNFLRDDEYRKLAQDLMQMRRMLTSLLQKVNRERQEAKCLAPTAKCDPQNFVTSVKLNPFTFIAGTTISNASSPLVRTGVLICSTFESISIKL
jgi:hypothetical protein